MRYAYVRYAYAYQHCSELVDARLREGSVDHRHDETHLYRQVPCPSELTKVDPRQLFVIEDVSILLQGLLSAGVTVLEMCLSNEGVRVLLLRYLVLVPRVWTEL